jgi:chromate transport protein ChrA
MDAKAKEQFRWKFYSLALQLNAIILLVALTVIAFFLVPLPFRYPSVAVMLIIAGILTWLFRKKYTETRAWLDEQPDKKEDA